MFLILIRLVLISFLQWKILSHKYNLGNYFLKTDYLLEIKFN